MVAHCHKKLFCSQTAFARVAVAGLIMGLGSVICVIGDIFWVFSDINHAFRPAHAAVAVFLGVAAIVQLVSFVWLYRGISIFLGKKESNKLHKLYHQAKINVFQKK